MPIDPLTIGLFALIAIMIFFMFRNSRKRRQEAEKLQEQMVPGVEIMTQHGIFATIVSIDDETNQAVIETTPGTQLRVHRQVIARVVEPELEPVDEESTETDEDAVAEPVTDEPEYGERTDEDEPKRSAREKPAE